MNPKLWKHIPKEVKAIICFKISQDKTLEKECRMSAEIPLGSEKPVWFTDLWCLKATVAEDQTILW